MLLAVIAACEVGGAPRPVKPPKSERARRERAGWYRHLLAYGVGVGIMIGLGLLSGRGYDAALGPAWTWTIVLVIDAVVSFSHSFEGSDSEEEAREKQSV